MNLLALLDRLEQQVRDNDLNVRDTAREVSQALREEAPLWTPEEIQSTLTRLDSVQELAREQARESRKETAKKGHNRRAIKGYRHLRGAHLAQRTRTTA
jgi:hypothetical protein